MWLKKLFTVPDGQKITEKVFGRVLVSSVCGMLLCMACLAGTTWAWFTVDIENTGNVIRIAAVSVETAVFHGEDQMPKNENEAYELPAGTYRLQVSAAGTATEPDSFGTSGHPVYVLMTVTKASGTEYYCLPFAGGSGTMEKELSFTEQAVVSFAVSWIEPASVVTVDEAEPLIGQRPTEPPTETATQSPAEETTTGPVEEEATQAPTSAPTEPTQPPTPTEGTEPPSGE